MGKLGCLNFLAANCPAHSQIPLPRLQQLFLPAVECGGVRLFQNDNGLPCVGLLWARLSDDVSRRMVFEGRPPAPGEWNSGPNLWFLDILAPFGHGKQIIRHIARNPPEGAFYFARVGANGMIKRVVEGFEGRREGKRLRAFAIV